MEQNSESGPHPKRLKTSDGSKFENGSSKNGIQEKLKSIRIGSRKSQLALFQANFVADILRKKHPEIFYEIKTMSTTGDNILHIPLSKIGEKSLFTKELEVALANNEVDIIVHSLKDLPTTLPPGMIIGGICKRESPYDVVVFSPKNEDLKSLQSLPKGSVIGTSSLRRIAQLKRTYPKFEFNSVRGNLNTRLRKLDEDNVYDALILAAAGLERMDMNHRISEVLSPDVCMYAVGQGALAIECKASDQAIVKLLSEISDAETIYCCICERAFMRTLEGGCSVPVAVCSKFSDNELSLRGGVFSLDGKKNLIEHMETLFSEQGSGDNTKQVEIFLSDKSSDDRAKECESVMYCGVVANHLPEAFLIRAEQLGVNLAQSMLKKGAGEILSTARLQNAITN